MCSIFGFAGRTPHSRPTLRTLQAIVRGNEPRGPHAFGFAWVDARGRLRAFKQTGRMTDHLGALAMARDARMLVGHLRFATHGDARDNINNHPHPADGGWIVHNGVVRNYERLLARHDLTPVSACDSEVLGLLIETADGDTLAARVAEAIGAADGPLAMLGLWSRPGTMVAARRGNPLHAAATSEGLYLASLAAGLPAGAYAVADNRLSRITQRGGKLVCGHTKLPEPRVSRWPSYGDSELFDAATYRGG